MEVYDVIIIGGGIYGIHTAFNNKFKNKRVLVIEKENDILKGASFINQARLHNGYHYPRSYETAKMAKDYFEKCYKEYSFAINRSFNSIYAISKQESLTDANAFEVFCDNLSIPYKEIDKNIFFNNNMIEKAYLTKEYVFDIDLIREYYHKRLNGQNGIKIKYNSYIKNVQKESKRYILNLNDGEIVSSNLIISTVYSNINHINRLFNQKAMDLKYELCEVQLIRVNEKLKNYAITIMDGPFFSIMPFGKKNIHTLTSVNFTPHEEDFNNLPEFSCQQKNKICRDVFIKNCNECLYRPKPDIQLFNNLYKKFIKEEFEYKYCDSLYTVKPILISSEEDDARPTIIKKYTSEPTFIACLSGKFSTVYLLDEFIKKEIDI